MEPLSTAPPVVAVVVTCDAGPWLEETLGALGAQDYPNLSVLVVDSASVVDPTERIAAVLPSAFVRRLPGRVGFGSAANEVLGVVEGASHYAFCHDDVAPAPDALRALVEEAFRSNAGIVTPKLVEWDEPDHLLAVGMGADRLGVLVPLIERGELDQEQHDTVRDVFVAPSSLTLVRSDLFVELGGFAADVDQFGEDLDISWRAQVLGARVICAPTARVRHLEAQQRGLRAGWASPLARRRAEAVVDEHRLRSVTVCSGRLGLLRMLTLAVVSSLVEAFGQLVTGRPGEAALTLRSLGRAGRRPRQLIRRRRSAQRMRHVSDRKIRHLQSSGNAKLRGFLQTRIKEGPGPALPLASPSDTVVPGRHRRSRRAGGLEASLNDGSTPVPGTTASDFVSVGSGGWRLPVVVVAVLVAFLVVGSRGLFDHDLPAVGQIPVTSGGVGGWWRSWWSTWQGGLLGAQGSSPPGLGLLAAAGTVFLGAVGTLQKVLVLAPLVVGPFGAYRAARWWGSLRGRVAALVVYAVVPVPYNALARGEWPALLCYAAAPWVLSMIARLSNEWPFPPTGPRQVAGRCAGIGIVVALVAAFEPSWLLVVPVVGVAFALGSLIVGQIPTALRLLAVALVASVVAIALLAPWSLGVLQSRVATFGPGGKVASPVGLGQILRMHTGPVGGLPLGWALLVAAALPLVIGRSWRLAWAGRLWIVALSAFALAWAGSRGWILAPQPESLLAFAAAALAGSVALGVVAFELDLPGYQFGWRQLASAVAALSVLLAAVPTVLGAGDGRWHLPSTDTASVLGFLPGPGAGDYRVLWIGAPAALPLGSQYLSNGVGYATSFDGQPVEANLWAPPRTTGSAALATMLRQSDLGLTTQLGHLLAPFAVRYVVVVTSDAPSGGGATAAPLPVPVNSHLAEQTDLSAVAADPDVTVYINSAWAPARAVVSRGLDHVLHGPQSAQAGLLGPSPVGAESRPVLIGGHQDGVTGLLPAPSTITVAQSRTALWTLLIDGHEIHPAPAYGWAMRFRVPAAAGDRGVVAATLSAGTSFAARLGQLVEIGVVIVVLGLITVDRRRRSARPPELVRPEWFVPLTLRRGSGRRSGSLSGLSGGDSDLGSDELWIDA